MPGVGSYKDKIFVVGGTDDSWTAQSSVEMFDTLSMEWLKLPDLLVSHYSQREREDNGLFITLVPKVL